MAESASRGDRFGFGPFRLDSSQRLLSREGSTIALRPKTLEVLLLLMRRVGEVVSKDEILATVWEGNAVSEYVLTTCISELRAALGDEPKRSRYLKTIHRSGYQFLAEVRDLDAAASERDVARRALPPIVGRERELEQLATALRQARAGDRQVVFITGEMGIGKSTLAEHFVAAATDHRSARATSDQQSSDAPRTGDVLVARGQCIEQFGAGEPYMPVYEAIGRLGRELDAPVVVDVLRRHAPTWLIQIPGLLPPELRAELRHELVAETQDHMLRVIADGIEALSEARLLVLLLEDLHLSDHATLELIAALALRRGPAQLLILGTFRSAESFAASSPFQSLKQQLLLHAQCAEIALAPLTDDAVDAYLTKRFDGLILPTGLGASIRARTEGNPMFVARLVDQLLEDGVLTVDAATNALRLAAPDIDRVPRNLRAMIEQRTDSLGVDEREIVEAASVAGVHFWSASVAGALGVAREEVERLCTQLSRRHGFLVYGESVDSTLPDLGARYQFSHGLYQQVLYERLDLTRRQRLHRAIGAALRTAWAERAPEIAAELASHFERGGELANAVDFYDKAAVAVASRGANREAVGYLDRALALLARGDDDPQRRERELALLLTRGPSVLAASGYGSIAVLDNYQRALERARQLDNPMAQMSSLLALSICQQTRANLAQGEQLALELVDVAERMGLPPPIVVQLHNPLSQVRLYQGAVEESLALADAAVAAMQIFSMPQPPPDSRPALWAEPSVMLHCQRGAASFALGRLAQAGAAIEQALRIAHDLRHPFNLAYASCWAALYEDTIGQWQRAIELAQQAIDAAHTYDFPFWEGIAKIICGHAMVRRDAVTAGSALLHQGLELWRGTGARLAMTTHCSLLADVCLIANDVAGAEAAIAEADTHAAETGEQVFMPEIRRLQAECQRRRGMKPDTVEATLRLAIGSARQHGTKLWELRANTALHQLRQSAETRQELATICRAFDDEPPTHDVASARAALTPT